MTSVIYAECYKKAQYDEHRDAESHGATYTGPRFWREIFFSSEAIFISINLINAWMLLGWLNRKTIDHRTPSEDSSIKLFTTLTSCSKLACLSRSDTLAQSNVCW
jgi:hypothetical protein